MQHKKWSELLLKGNCIRWQILCRENPTLFQHSLISVQSLTDYCHWLETEKEYCMHAGPKHEALNLTWQIIQITNLIWCVQLKWYNNLWEDYLNFLSAFVVIIYFISMSNLKMNNSYKWHFITFPVFQILWKCYPMFKNIIC